MIRQAASIYIRRRIRRYWQEPGRCRFPPARRCKTKRRFLSFLTDRQVSSLYERSRRRRLSQSEGCSR